MNGFGGTEKVVANFCDAFKLVSPTDVTLKVIDLGGTTDTAWTLNRPITVVGLGKHRFTRNIQYALTLYSRISKILRQETPDFLISTNPLMWSFAKRICEKTSLQTKVIAWYHYSLSRKPVRSQMLRAADFYWAISSGIRDELIAAGIEKAKIQLVFNPVVPQSEMISRSKNHNRLVYMGRTILDGQKNLRELLLALANVKYDWQLDVYGDGEDRDKAPELAQQLGIAERVKWHGFVPDSWQQITEADALILTSTYEGFPMVLVEALSYGVYVISSDVQTGPQDIIDSGNGQLYDLGKIEQLQQAIERVLRDDNMPRQQALVESVEKYYLNNYMTNVLALLKG
ncbi:UDP-D-galactose (glucosyl)lipopolysaccharide-1 [Furfurilactobacillus siliginis]|nr:UDP-D-galactose (glucosyl)lipopolysaccharide-1 [Furfurilactobacillus siliginis]